ncbi:MAG: NADH-quinone oxidoreductase subunit L [candidate division WOR-3 bacterium]|nr:MAG: NADH-quinone oxidoreductase subunit L [candidate division WOR-3 bacterium]
MHPFLILVCVPLAAGILGWIIGRLRNEFSFIGAVLSLYFAFRLFWHSRGGIEEFELVRIAGIPVAFRLDSLSGFILLFVAVFGVLILLFSFRYMKHWRGTRGYYFYMMLTLAGSYAVLLSANLFTLLIFWGALLVVLYGILLVGRRGAEKAAGKALVIVGLGDFAMLLGIALLLARGGMIDLRPQIPMPLHDGTMILAFVLLAVGALAKAGSMPLHTWIPQASKTSPATVMAFIPASLDKLLGIYLLTRLSVYVFDIATNVALRNILMTVGAVTVLGAVMMALVQKRVMRLLSFHAVSQVGYMVLGIGTGTPIGIAGGLFHMLNHSIYKAGLFLSAGTAEYMTGTEEIDKLGGLGRQMPITFFSFLVCALAIAGIPPLNGFVSKWMVYQGIIQIGGEGNRLFPVFLTAAMLGSVLTLASFLKLLHSIFLGQRPAALARVREGSFAMWVPTAILALTCIAFGVFAISFPLRSFIYPSLPMIVQPPGIWQPVLATLLVLIGLGVGAVVYLLGTGRKPAAGRSFVGGERIAYDEESRVTGTAFYTSVKRMPIVGDLLRFGEEGAFDLSNWVKGIMAGLGGVFRNSLDLLLDRGYQYLGQLVKNAGQGLSYVMTGRLTLYLAMILVGAAIFYVVLLLG